MDKLVSNPSEDHGPLMAGALWGLFALASMFVGLRLYSRVSYSKLWYDDAFMVIGEVSYSQTRQPWACELTLKFLPEARVSISRCHEPAGREPGVRKARLRR